nr:MAG TPA: hypothetical protein [Caudoviricetes sp.]
MPPSGGFLSIKTAGRPFSSGGLKYFSKTACVMSMYIIKSVSS